MLVRLLYASRAVDASPEAIESILSQSRGYNPANGITGVLCHGGGIFLQCIEGGRTQINELYGHIVRDPRHREVTLLHYEEILERRFGGWSMGQVNVSKANHTQMLKYSERPELDPYALSGKVSLALLEDLAATAAVCGRV
jgi:uncharacterized protein (UPF0297 family)